MHFITLRSKPLLFHLALIIIAFGISEATLQVACFFSPTLDFILSEAQWHHVINDTASGMRYSRKCPDLDEDGFRNKANPPPYDVLALGDSNTLGLFNDYRDIWPSRLASSTDMKVYNMGMPGYSLLNYYYLRDKLTGYGAKHIVYQFTVGNDLLDSYKFVYKYNGLKEHRTRNSSLQKMLSEMQSGLASGRRYRRYHYCNTTDGPITRFDFCDSVFANSRLYWLARDIAFVVQRIWGGRSLRLLYRGRCIEDVNSDSNWYYADNGVCRVFDLDVGRVGFKPGFQHSLLDMSDPRIREGLRLNLLGFSLLRDVAGSGGSEFHVAIIPTKEYVYYHSILSADDVPGVYTDLVRDEEAVIRATREFLESEGISYIDLTQAFNESLRGGDSPYFLWDDHINRRGNEILAREVGSLING
ncbi:hypothetical protein ACFLRF_06360 [Candidatus Altiarchaeota archaeon]